MKRILTALAIVVALSVTAVGASAGILETVKQRGTLNCGIYTNFPGFSSLAADGTYRGFDIDFCRAVAAAVGVQLKQVPLSATDRFPSLQAKTVDMLSMVTTDTASREFSGLQFPAVTFYDGQGFVTHTAAALKSARDLNGATICVLQGTTTELNLADWFRANRLRLNAVTFSSEDELLRAYQAGRCDAMTGSIAIMAGRVTNFPDPREHVVLSEVISKEPLAVVTADGDEKWTRIVRWVIYATMIAEEKGITSQNVEEMRKSSQDPEIQRLLGVTASFAQDMGLDAAWAARVLQAVGNYGEIFERNLGESTPLRLKRGQNALWSKGGLLYPAPFR
jgi:general L-amino acid transport system substrate-binding protein